MLVFESFSRPSRRSVIEPPTSVMPCARAQRAIASTDSPPSRVSAAACSWSRSPIAFHFSGRTTTSAPDAAALATSGSVFSRFAALSDRLVSWTQATRSVPDIDWQDSSGQMKVPEQIMRESKTIALVGASPTPTGPATA